MGKDDDKSVNICEDLAYRIIRYTNIGVIEADEFRKNLGIKKKSINLNRNRNNSHNNENICKRKYGKTVPNSWTTLSC